MKDQYDLYIPVELCRIALSGKNVSPLKLYICLKGKCAGKIKLDKRDILRLSRELDCHPKTISNNLKKLIDLNWIGHDKNCNVYFIRGFCKIAQMHGFKSRTGAEFRKKDLNLFKSFVAGSFIGYLANQQKRRRWVSERHTVRSKHLTRRLSSKYYPISNLALAKILNISISTAFELKKIAHKDGYIDLKRNYKDTGISGFEKRNFKKRVPEFANRVKVKKGFLIVSEPDSVMPLIRFKSRKKIETYIQYTKSNNNQSNKS